MIAFAMFLFALLVVAWLLMPGGERQLQFNVESTPAQPETHSA